MADLTSAANAIMSVITPQLVDSTFLNKEIFDLAPKGVQSTSGSGAHRWVALTGANSSGGTADPNGGLFPASASVTLQQASLTPQLFDAAMRVTDELDAALQGSADPVGVLAVEMQSMLNRVYDNFSAMVLSSTAPLGIELAVDSAGTYAAVSHATTGWGSRETAVGGALTSAVLYNDEEALALPDRATSADLSIVSHEQLTNYCQLGGLGNSSIQNSPVRVNVASGEVGDVNLGMNRRVAYFGQQRIVPIRDLTNTIWLMGVADEVEIYAHERPSLNSVRGLVVENSPRAGYEKKIVGSWYGIFKIANPFHWAKDTGVTA